MMDHGNDKLAASILISAVDASASFNVCRVRRSWFALTAVLLMTILAMTGCDRRDSREKMGDPKDFLPDIEDRKRIEAALGDQGELSSTHLTLRWSAVCKRDLPIYVEIKVPREYLFRDPLFFHENCVQRVHVGLIVPGAAPWPNHARREGVPASLQSREAHPRTWPQLAHVGLSPGSGSVKRRVDGIRERASRSEYLPAEEFAGLERRRRFSCFSELDAKNHEGTRAFLAAKRLDDKSPPNCWTIPGAAILTTPHSVTSNEEAVGMDCHETGCITYFATGFVGLEVTIPRENLEHWGEIVSAARKLVRSFIVYESRDAYDAGIRVLTKSDLSR